MAQVFAFSQILAAPDKRGSGGLDLRGEVLWQRRIRSAAARLLKTTGVVDTRIRIPGFGGIQASGRFLLLLLLLMCGCLRLPRSSPTVIMG